MWTDDAKPKPDADESPAPQVDFVLRSEDLVADEEPVAPPPPTPAELAARLEGRRRLRAAMHRPDTREVILAWCLWLLITWVILGFGASPAAIRWMVFLSLGGLVMLWPVFRLSQDGFARRTVESERPVPLDSPEAKDVPALGAQAGPAEPPARSALTPGLILRDWLGMNIIFQAVVWPQIITSRWHSDQAMFVSIAVAAWSLLVAAIVAWGCQRRQSAARTLAMAAILLILWGEPLLMLAARAVPSLSAAAFTWTMHISPIEAIYALTAPASTFEPEPWRPTLIAVLVAGSVAWIGVAVGSKK